MLFKKRKKEELQSAPLNYWEEQSYMIIIPKDENADLFTGLFERVAAITGVTIIDKKKLEAKKPGCIKLKYEDEEYEIGFYPSSFVANQYLFKTGYHFTDEEMEQLLHERPTLTIFMTFGNDSKKSYHLQLKIAHAIVPEMLAIYDESSERMISAKWVELTSSSNVVPSSNDLYLVQAVTDPNGEVWLHTHGLCRCGLTELEILKSNRQNYQNHYNLLSTYASFLLDKRADFNCYDQSAYIGMLSNRMPIVVTCLPWTKALSRYPKLTIGGVEDRKEGHNSQTSVIFAYQSEKDEREKKLSDISIYDDYWDDNSIFFISKEETARMKALAIERFSFVKEQFLDKQNKVLLKIGLLTSSNQEDSLEHIWFELIDIKDDVLKVKLTQEPYDVPNAHKNDVMTFKIEDITDWIIYTREYSVTPSNAYLLIS